MQLLGSACRADQKLKRVRPARGTANGIPFPMLRTADPQHIRLLGHTTRQLGRTRQGGQVAVDKFPAGGKCIFSRQRLVWLRSRHCAASLLGRVHAKRAEQPHVAPFFDILRDQRPFEDPHLESGVDAVQGGLQSMGPAPMIAQPLSNGAQCVGPSITGEIVCGGRRHRARVRCGLLAEQQLTHDDGGNGRQLQAGAKMSGSDEQVF